MRGILIVVAGGIMILGAAAHALAGWPTMEAALLEAGAGGEVVGALAIGWYWGSAAMLAFGAITLRGGLRLLRGDGGQLPAVRVVAACYTLFGLAAFLGRGLHPHFLFFVLTGLLAGGPAQARGARASGPGA